MLKKTLTSVVGLCCAITSIAQDSTQTIHIPQVEIKESRIHFMDLYENADSLSLLEEKTANLDDFLQEHTTMYIRESGNGQLASISVRGANPGHTKIL